MTEFTDIPSLTPLNPDRLLELLELGDSSLIRNELSGHHPADIAATIEHMPHELKLEIISLLDNDTAADVVAELDDQDQALLIRKLPALDIADIVRELDSDDAADLLASAKDEQTEAVLEHLDEEDRSELTELLSYDEESAGGIMAKEGVSVQTDTIVSDAINILREKAADVGDIYHIYAVDSDGILQGYLSLKRLILAQPNQKISNIMKSRDVAVNVNMDREEVAVLFGKYDLASAPVVDGSGRFIGRITHDDILDVLSEETEEDLAHMTRQSEFDPGERSLFRNIRLRLPWLLVGLLGGLIAAKVIAFFEPQFTHLTTLVLYLPLVAAMGGNAGIQTSSLMVRGLATGEVSSYRLKKRLLGEIGVALISGFICSTALFFITWGWHGNIILATVLSAALLSVIFLSAIIGFIVPLILKNLNLDPALATGPFITTSNDIIGLLIYLAIATAFIAYL
ncbi:MAG: magnesium transporter [Calditrichaeota bacterium]|nr:magnesium transporter [Calditrichota bacterium]